MLAAPRRSHSPLTPLGTRGLLASPSIPAAARRDAVAPPVHPVHPRHPWLPLGVLGDLAVQSPFRKSERSGTRFPPKALRRRLSEELELRWDGESKPRFRSVSRLASRPDFHSSHETEMTLSILHLRVEFHRRSSDDNEFESDIGEQSRHQAGKLERALKQIAGRGDVREGFANVHDRILAACRTQANNWASNRKHAGNRSRTTEGSTPGPIVCQYLGAYFAFPSKSDRLLAQRNSPRLHEMPPFPHRFTDGTTALKSRQTGQYASLRGRYKGTTEDSEGMYG